MSSCPKCGRPLPTGYPAGAKTCVGGSGCKRIAFHYRRGLADGVALAKRTARTRDDYSINWTETDNEAAKLAGEG